MTQIERIINEISLLTVEEWKEFHRAYTKEFVEPILKKMEGNDA